MVAALWALPFLKVRGNPNGCVIATAYGAKVLAIAGRQTVLLTGSCALTACDGQQQQSTHSDYLNFACS